MNCNGVHFIPLHENVGTLLSAKQEDQKKKKNSKDDLNYMFNKFDLIKRNL